MAGFPEEQRFQMPLKRLLAGRESPHPQSNRLENPSRGFCGPCNSGAASASLPKGLSRVSEGGERAHAVRLHFVPRKLLVLSAEQRPRELSEARTPASQRNVSRKLAVTSHPGQLTFHFPSAKRAPACTSLRPSLLGSKPQKRNRTKAGRSAPAPSAPS